MYACCGQEPGDGHWSFCPGPSGSLSVTRAGGTVTLHVELADVADLEQVLAQVDWARVGR